MTQLPLKYNPGLSSSSELEDQFVVRLGYLQLLIETLRENIGSNSNQHLLVVGPRGAGKTMLVHRVASALRTETTLCRHFIPIVFAEESYTIGTPGEFWLEALERLGDEIQDHKLLIVAEQLKQERDDVHLRERCLGLLVSHAKERGKKLVLIVENLNMLLTSQISRNDAWDLRHTLLNQPELILLATAITNIFSEIKHSSKAWFELFSVYNLDPLTPAESVVLWTSITKKEPSQEQLRPVQILTGGNPRLLRILAEFASQSSLHDLMRNLIALVDEHTEYFKSQIDLLPPVERKVFVSLLDLWEPVSTRQVAEAARIPSTACSALLNRLVSRGVAVASRNSQRKKLYEAAERLYNIYYLLRKRGHPSQRVKAVVRFMISFYHQTELIESTVRIATEACRLGPEGRGDHYAAYEEILTNKESQQLAKAIIAATPPEFFSSSDLPNSIKNLVDSLRNSGAVQAISSDSDSSNNPYLWISIARELAEQGRSQQEVEAALMKAIQLGPENGHLWAHLGTYLSDIQERKAEALKALEKAVRFSPEDPWAWYRYGNLLEDLGRLDESVEVTEKSITLKRDYRYAWSQLGRLYHELGRFKDAERALIDGIQSVDKSNTADLWADLGEIYQYHLGRLKAAESAYRQALAAPGEKDKGTIFLQLGQLAIKMGGREKEAERYFRIAEKVHRRRLKKNPHSASDWAQLGDLLVNIDGQESEAERAVRRAIELAPDRERLWDGLMDCLNKAGKLAEAEIVASEALGRFQDSKSWRRLGWVYERRKKYTEAIDAYEKAIELQPDFAIAWAELGLVLIRSNSNPERAEVALVKAAELGAEPQDVWPELIRLKALRGEAKAKIVELANDYLSSTDRTSDELNGLAWTLYRTARADLVPAAHVFAEEAVRNSGAKDWSYNHTLSVILCIQKRFVDVLPLLTAIFDAGEHSSTAIRYATELTIIMAAAGYAEEILSILQQSKGRPSFEPIETALHQLIGTEVIVPLEVSEVAKDVMDRVGKLKLAMQIEGAELPI